jgi:hypothetical protein
MAAMAKVAPLERFCREAAAIAFHVNPFAATQSPLNVGRVHAI